MTQESAVNEGENERAASFYLWVKICVRLSPTSVAKIKAWEDVGTAHGSVKFPCGKRLGSPGLDTVPAGWPSCPPSSAHADEPHCSSPELEPATVLPTLSAGGCTSEHRTALRTHSGSQQTGPALRGQGAPPESAHTELHAG